MIHKIPNKLKHVLDGVLTPTGSPMFECYSTGRDQVAQTLLDAYPELREGAPKPTPLLDEIDRLHDKVDELRAEKTNRNVEALKRKVAAQDGETEPCSSSEITPPLVITLSQQPLGKKWRITAPAGTAITALKIELI